MSEQIDGLEIKAKEYADLFYSHEFETEEILFKKADIKIAYKQGFIDATEWHYPSKGELPIKRGWYLGIFEEADTGFELVPVVCDYVGEVTKATTEEGWIISHCTDVDNPLDYYKKLKCVAWQYIVPPKL